MGTASITLWRRRPVAAVGLTAAWIAFAGAAFAREWTERLLRLADL